MTSPASNNLPEQFKRLKATLATQSDEIATLTSESNNLRELCSEQKATLEKRSSEYTELKSELVVVNCNLRESNTKNVELKQSNLKYLCDKDEIQNKCNELQDKYDKNQKQCSENAALKLELGKVNCNLRKTSSENSMLKQLNLKYVCEKEDIQNKFDELQNEYDKIRNQYNEIGQLCNEIEEKYDGTEKTDGTEEKTDVTEGKTDTIVSRYHRTKNKKPTNEKITSVCDNNTLQKDISVLGKNIRMIRSCDAQFSKEVREHFLWEKNRDAFWWIAFGIVCLVYGIFFR